jgi:hypothetical protein
LQEGEEEEEGRRLEEENDGQLNLKSPHAIPAAEISEIFPGTELRDLDTDAGNERSQEELQKTICMLLLTPISAIAMASKRQQNPHRPRAAATAHVKHRKEHY